MITPTPIVELVVADHEAFERAMRTLGWAESMLRRSTERPDEYSARSTQDVWGWWKLFTAATPEIIHQCEYACPACARCYQCNARIDAGEIEMTPASQSPTPEGAAAESCYCPFTPGGTPLMHIAADTEAEAWANLLEDAAHMPYACIDGFKARGYTVEHLEWCDD